MKQTQKTGPKEVDGLSRCPRCSQRACLEETSIALCIQQVLLAKKMPPPILRFQGLPDMDCGWRRLGVAVWHGTGLLICCVLTPRPCIARGAECPRYSRKWCPPSPSSATALTCLPQTTSSCLAPRTTRVFPCNHLSLRLGRKFAPDSKTTATYSESFV